MHGFALYFIPLGANIKPERIEHTRTNQSFGCLSFEAWTRTKPGWLSVLPWNWLLGICIWCVAERFNPSSARRVRHEVMLKSSTLRGKPWEINDWSQGNQTCCWLRHQFLLLNPYPNINSRAINTRHHGNHLISLIISGSTIFFSGTAFLELISTRNLHIFSQVFPENSIDILADLQPLENGKRVH